MIQKNNKESDQRILVVENDIDTLMMMFDLFGNRYPLVLCSSSYHAIENINQKDFALIFISYFLPEISGIDLMRIIRRMRPMAEIVMLVEFSSLEIQHELEALNDSKVDFVIKPVQPRIIEYIVQAKIKEAENAVSKAIIQPQKQPELFAPIEVLLMTRDGLPIYRRSKKQDVKVLNDKSIFAGVLSVIQSVISEEFKDTVNNSTTSIKVGELSVIVHQGTEGLYNLVVVGVGEVPESLTKDVANVMKILDKPLTRVIKEQHVISTEMVEKTIEKLDNWIPKNLIGDFFKA